MLVFVRTVLILGISPHYVLKVWHLTGLTELWLTNNDLQAIPPQIRELGKLRTLGVGRNRIGRFALLWLPPPILVTSTMRKHIMLSGRDFFCSLLLLFRTGTAYLSVAYQACYVSDGGVDRFCLTGHESVHMGSC